MIMILIYYWEVRSGGLGLPTVKCGSSSLSPSASWTRKGSLVLVERRPRLWSLIFFTLTFITLYFFDLFHFQRNPALRKFYAHEIAANRELLFKLVYCRWLVRFFWIRFRLSVSATWCSLIHFVYFPAVGVSLWREIWKLKNRRCRVNFRCSRLV